MRKIVVDKWLWDEGVNPRRILNFEPAILIYYVNNDHIEHGIWPQIIEDAGYKFGGGTYEIKLFDSDDRKIKTRIFEIAGLPKIPCNCSNQNLLNFGCKNKFHIK